MKMYLINHHESISFNKRLWIKTLVIISLCIQLSCENELIPYKLGQSIPVIYGVLDPADSIFYVKIEKTLVGDTDALILSRVDSNKYFSNVEANLEYINPDSSIDRIYLSRMDVTGKTDGIFLQEPNFIYGGRRDDFDHWRDYGFMNEGHLKLTVYIKDINKIIECRTEIPAKPIFVEPKPGVQTLIFFSNETPYRIVFYRQYYYYYEVVILFKYSENRKDGTIQTKQLEFRTLYPPKENPFPYTDHMIEQQLTPQVFLNRIARQINDSKDVISRKFRGIDFIIRKGLPAYYDYFYSVTADLAIEVQPISNIPDGIGVFTCFSSTVSSDHMLNPAALYILCNDTTTRHLKFIYP